MCRRRAKRTDFHGNCTFKLTTSCRETNWNDNEITLSQRMGVSRVSLYWQLCIKTFYRCASNLVRLTNIGPEGSQTIDVAVIEGFSANKSKRKRDRARDKSILTHFSKLIKEKEREKLVCENLFIMLNITG